MHFLNLLHYHFKISLIVYVLLIIYYNIYDDHIFKDKPQNNTHYVKAISSFIASLIPGFNVLAGLMLIYTFIHGYKL